MSIQAIKLRLPTNRTASGPKFRSDEATAADRRALLVDYDYENDDGTVSWAQIIFEEVLAFEFRQNVCIRAADVIGSREIRCLCDSEFLSELMLSWKLVLGSDEYQRQLGGEARFKHFTMYFDDAGVINVVAARCRIGAP